MSSRPSPFHLLQAPTLDNDPSLSSTASNNNNGSHKAVHQRSNSVYILTMNASAIASKISAVVARPGARSLSSTANVWVDKNTRVICQGFTGKQVRCMRCCERWCHHERVAIWWNEDLADHPQQCASVAAVCRIQKFSISFIANILFFFHSFVRHREPSTLPKPLNTEPIWSVE